MRNREVVEVLVVVTNSDVVATSFTTGPVNTLESVLETQVNVQALA